MTLSPKLGVVEIGTLWHFRLPLPIQVFIKIASSPRLSRIGMPSPVLWSHLLKMQRIVLLSSHLWWALGTNSLITGPSEWLSFPRFTSKLSWSWMVSLRMCSTKLIIGRSHFSVGRPLSWMTLFQMMVYPNFLKVWPRPSKALGPDELHPRVLKELATGLGPVFAHLFQMSLDTGEIPKERSLANTCPLYKKGDRAHACNYRPVSLTCVLCKLHENIVCSNIMAHLDEYKLLSDNIHLEKGTVVKLSWLL